jgi:hypothetical protein
MFLLNLGRLVHVASTSPYNQQKHKPQNTKHKTQNKNTKHKTQNTKHRAATTLPAVALRSLYST